MMELLTLSILYLFLYSVFVYFFMIKVEVNSCVRSYLFVQLYNSCFLDLMYPNILHLSFFSSHKNSLFFYFVVHVYVKEQGFYEFCQIWIVQGCCSTEALIIVSCWDDRCRFASNLCITNNYLQVMSLEACLDYISLLFDVPQVQFVCCIAVVVLIIYGCFSFCISPLVRSILIICITVFSSIDTVRICNCL